MSPSIYHYAFIVLAFWLFRICLRSILALRFHFHFGRIGFFSINDVHYHHHRSSEAALWSVKVGKLKLRLRRRPTLSSPTPFITIHIADIQVQLHSLVALAAAARQHKKQLAQSKLNRRFSRVSSSLKKIPWWYSLSVVKHVIKFTSALPAQLLMAGLANYVDLQIDNFQLEIEQKAVVKLQYLNFSSVLFANVTIPSNETSGHSAPTSPSASNEYFHNRLPEGISSLHASYQRHSLKRAQHLFKEKFFEIMVKIGTITVVQKEEEDLLSLPTGGQVAVSCHLSAGCVTLKDVDVNTRVDSLDIKLSPLLKFIKSLKQTAVSEDEDKQQEYAQMYQKQLNTNNGGNIIQLLRSITFTVDNTAMKSQHGEGCYSSLSLQDIYISGLAETCVLGVDPYYKTQCTLGLTSWTLFNEKDEVKLITIPEIRSSANIAQSLVISKRTYDDLSSLDDNNVSTTNLKPNQKFANVTLTVREPRLDLDIAKMDMLNKLTSSNKSKKHQVREKGTNATYFNIPRASLSFTVETPSVNFKSLGKHDGVISWSSIVMDVSGIYSAQKNRPVSVLSRFSEPLTSFKDDSTQFHAESTAVQRVQSQTRPSWTNLFRRSWKAKTHETGEKNLKQWVYKATMRLTIQNTGFDHLVETRPTLESKKRHDVDEEPNTFISVRNFECDVQTKLDVSFLENVNGQDVVAVWDPSSHQINVDVAIDKPVLNLWANTDGESDMEFWITDIMQKIKSSLSTKKGPEFESDGTHQQQDRTDFFGYISVLKVNIMVTDIAMVLDGMDKGLRGSRQVPTGYLDNAPEKDIDVRVVISIQQVAYVFNGSRIYASTRGKHQYSLSVGSISTNDTDDETIAANENIKSQQLTFGTSRLSIQHVVVERIFKTDDYLEETGWHHHEDRKVFILWISRINTRTEMMLEAGHQVVVMPSFVIKKNGFQYTVSNHYACLVTAMSTLSMVKRCFPKGEKRSTGQRPSNLEIRTIQLQINRSDFHIFLPGEEAQLYLRMDSLRTQWNNTLDNHGDVPSTAIRNITLYGIAPRHPNQWDQLLELDNLRFSIEKDVDFTNGTLTKTNQLYMSKFYIRIPCGYQLSNVVDGTVTLIKGIKTMHARILKGVSFLYFGPNEKKEPVLMPNIRVECDLFTIQFEDDPFEARLRSIWKTGLSEQANRIAIQDAFEAKARSLKESGYDKGKIVYCYTLRERS